MLPNALLGTWRSLDPALVTPFIYGLLEYIVVPAFPMMSFVKS